MYLSFEVYMGSIITGKSCSILCLFVTLSWVDNLFQFQVSLCQHFVIFVSDDFLFSREVPLLIQIHDTKPILTANLLN
jgi:hypothetical protein